MEDSLQACDTPGPLIEHEIINLLQKRNLHQEKWNVKKVYTRIKGDKSFSSLFS